MVIGIKMEFFNGNQKVESVFELELLKKKKIVSDRT